MRRVLILGETNGIGLRIATALAEREEVILMGLPSPEVKPRLPGSGWMGTLQEATSQRMTSISFMRH